MRRWRQSRARRARVREFFLRVWNPIGLQTIPQAFVSADAHHCAHVIIGRSQPIHSKKCGVIHHRNAWVNVSDQGHANINVQGLRRSATLSQSRQLPCRRFRFAIDCRSGGKAYYLLSIDLRAPTRRRLAANWSDWAPLQLRARAVPANRKNGSHPRGLTLQRSLTIA
jgi:hypothetical protein